MRRPVLVLTVLLAACGDAPTPPQPQPDQPGWAGPREAAPTGKLDRSRAGSAAPGAAFEDPDGEMTSLAEFRGKPLLVNLWATWCAPCVAEMPTLDALAERQKGKLQVVTISEDLDGREKIEGLFKKQGYRNLETWLDPQMVLMGELETGTLPTTILYDARGREVWRIVGSEDWTGKEAAQLLREAGP